MMPWLDPRTWEDDDKEKADFLDWAILDIRRSKSLQAIIRQQLDQSVRKVCMEDPWYCRCHGLKKWRQDFQCRFWRLIRSMLQDYIQTEGASFEMLRALYQKLPPMWMHNLVMDACHDVVAELEQNLRALEKTFPCCCERLAEDDEVHCPKHGYVELGWI